MLVASHPHFVTTRLFPCPFLARHPSNTALPPVPYCHRNPSPSLRLGYAASPDRFPCCQASTGSPISGLKFTEPSLRRLPPSGFPGSHASAVVRDPLVRRRTPPIPACNHTSSAPSHVLTSHDFSHISLVLVRSHRPRTRHIYLLTSLCRWPV